MVAVVAAVPVTVPATAARAPVTAAKVTAVIPRTTKMTVVKAMARAAMHLAKCLTKRLVFSRKT